MRPPSLSYRIVTSAVHDTARVEWKGVTDHDANCLAAGGVSPHEKSVLDEAVEFLRDELGRGPVMAQQVFKDAREAGVAEITLRRAKTTLRVRSGRHGTEGWAWRLPDEDNHRPTAARNAPAEAVRGAAKVIRTPLIIRMITLIAFDTPGRGYRSIRLM